MMFQNIKLKKYLLGLLFIPIVMGCQSLPNRLISQNNLVSKDAFAKFSELDKNSQARVVTALTQRVKSTNPDIRFSAITVLGKLGASASSAAPVIVESLLDKNQDVSSAASKALVDMRVVDVREFATVIKNESWQVRLLALTTLRKMRDRHAVPDFIWMMKDENEGIRLAAIEAIGELGSASMAAVPDLILAAKDTNEKVCIAAVVALKHIGSSAKAAVPILVALAKDGSNVIRLSSLEALGEIGPAAYEALPVVKSAMADSNAEVSSCAANAFKKINPSLDLIVKMRDKNLWNRVLAIKKIETIVPVAEETVPSLMSALKDDSQDVRIAALHALGKIGAGSKESVPVITKMIKDEGGWAIEALGEIGPEAKSAIPTLVREAAYNPQDPNIKRYIEDAVKKIDPSVEIKDLIKSKTAEIRAKYHGQGKTAIRYTQEYGQLVWKHNLVLAMCNGIPPEWIFDLNITAFQCDDEPWYYLVKFTLNPQKNWKKSVALRTGNLPSQLPDYKESVVAVFAVNMEELLVSPAAGETGQAIGGPGIAGDLIAYSNAVEEYQKQYREEMSN